MKTGIQENQLLMDSRSPIRSRTSFAGVTALETFYETINVCCKIFLQSTNMFTVDHDSADVSNPRTRLPLRGTSGQVTRFSADFLGLGSDYTSLFLFGLIWHALCLYQKLYSPQRRPSTIFRTYPSTICRPCPGFLRGATGQAG